jgi:hypothetical protein
MTKALAFSLILFLMAMMPIELQAKGNTKTIIITGSRLAGPISITDPAVLEGFNVWTGPGASSNELESLNVNWAGGAVEPPKDIPTFTVSFVTTRTNPGTYIVRYALDQSTGHGYVYILGKEDVGYRDNVFLIYRGVEGKWFHASQNWQKLVDQLIANSEKSGRFK